MAQITPEAMHIQREHAWSDVAPITARNKKQGKSHACQTRNLTGKLRRRSAKLSHQKER